MLYSTSAYTAQVENGNDMFYFTKQAIIGQWDSDHACCIEDRLSYLCCISHGDFSGGNGSDGTGKDSFGNGTQRCKEMDPVAWKYVLSAGRGDEDRSDPFHFI